MKTHESEPELGSDDQSELSREDSNPPLDTPKLQNTSQIEIKVERPISNDNEQNLIVHQNDIYLAALRGDWKAAITAMKSDKDIARIEVTEREDRALHIAAAAKQTAFVRKLVELMNPSDLEVQNTNGETAFFIAAQSGDVQMAKVMYQKNHNLPNLPSLTSRGMTPLEMAIFLGNREMVEYLYPITNFEDLNPEEYMKIIAASIRIDMYDIALRIINARDKRVVSSPTKNIGRALKVLAQKPLSHPHSIQGRIWERFVSIIANVPCIPYFKRIYTSLQMREQASELVIKLWKQVMTLPYSDILNLIEESKIFHDAAKIGNVEFLTLLSHSYPDLILRSDSKNYSIYHVAVINRQEEVFCLIYHAGVGKEIVTFFRDREGNNILHLAGKIAPPSRLNIASGAALQMQNELQWFKAVEKILRPSYRQTKNLKLQTPRELFTKKHEKLRDDGEKWMKDTATSCMVVATLIATVVFAAAFTVPGGYKEEKGSPIFLNDGWFTVFVIADAVAMFSSTASIMTFLSLFTAQYREDDFLFSLPTKLMVGIITLFTSIVCMVLTFTATFFLVYKKENQGTLPKFVAAFAGLPVALYALLNCRLWISLIQSTFFASRFMFSPGKHRLF